MIEIIDRLYLGDRDSADDRARLLGVGITHIVNCTDELPCFHPEDFTYLHLGLRDPDPAFSRCLTRVCAFIDEALERRDPDGKVLVHCFASISRSPATVLAYLCHRGEALEEAARRMGLLTWTDPDHLFLGQLLERHGRPREEALLRQLSRLLQGRAE